MKVMNHLKTAAKASLIAMAVTALAPAQGGTALWCEGTIIVHWIDAGGNAYVAPSWRGDHVALCNVNTTNAAGVTPTVCLGWIAIIRAAMQRNARTTIYCADAPVTSCAQMATYMSAPFPGYVMLH